VITENGRPGIMGHVLERACS